MNYIVYTNRPNGIVTKTYADSLRKAGQVIARSLHDNGYVKTRDEATEIAQSGERERYVQVGVKWFRILKQRDNVPESAFCLHCGGTEHQSVNCPRHEWARGL